MQQCFLWVLPCPAMFLELLHPDWRHYIFFFKVLFTYVLERGAGREKERERNIDRLPSYTPWPEDWNCNPGIYPDHELNQWPLALWNKAQPTEPNWSAWHYIFMVTSLNRAFSPAQPSSYNSLVIAPNCNCLPSFPPARGTLSSRAGLLLLEIEAFWIIKSLMSYLHLHTICIHIHS